MQLRGNLKVPHACGRSLGKEQGRGPCDRSPYLRLALRSPGSRCSAAPLLSSAAHQPGASQRKGPPTSASIGQAFGLSRSRWLLVDVEAGPAWNIVRLFYSIHFPPSQPLSPPTPISRDHVIGESCDGCPGLLRAL